MGRPARLPPDDFPETFERLGWEAKDHYGLHTTTFSRWLDDQGREQLRQRRRNYVLGNRMGRVSSLKPVAGAL